MVVKTREFANDASWDLGPTRKTERINFPGDLQGPSETQIVKLSP